MYFFLSVFDKLGNCDSLLLFFSSLKLSLDLSHTYCYMATQTKKNVIRNSCNDKNLALRPGWMIFLFF